MKKIVRKFLYRTLWDCREKKPPGKIVKLERISGKRDPTMEDD